MKKIIIAIVIFSMLLTVNSVFAKSKDEAQLQKAASLNTRADAPEDEPLPGDQIPGGEPSAPSVPVPDDPSAPIDAKVSQYYCVIPNDHVKNLETLCAKYNAPISIYRSFNQLVVLKRLGVLVKVNPKDTYFIKKLRENFNAKPLRKLSLKVGVSVNSMLNGVNKAAEASVKNEFEPIEEILDGMLKTPYGHNNTMFKTIARNFPGLLDKVTIETAVWSFNDYLGLGKKRKILYNRIITIELTALNMNGKDKHVTMFYKQFAYKTIKTMADQWGK
jgi:hypothetical protein